MNLPVRCFSCNTVLGNKWTRIHELRDEGVPEPEIHTQLGLRRECCKFVVQTAIASVGEEGYDYTTGDPIPLCDIDIDTIDTRRRQNGVVTCHRAV